MNSEINDSQEKQKNAASPSPESSFKQYLPHITVVLIALIIIVSIGGLIMTFAGGNNNVSDTELAFSLKPVGNLTTVEVKAAKVGVEVEANVQLCSFGGEYLVNGIVEAGIDLTHFTEASIVYDEENKRYNVTLPEPQITRCEFTVERYHDWQSLTCGNVDKDSLDKVVSFTTSKGIIQDVIDGGILDTSKIEARTLIGSIIQMLTEQDATINFVASTTPTDLPASCSQQEPKGWKLDSDGSWIPR